MDKVVDNALRGLPLTGLLISLLGLFVDSGAVVKVGIATVIAGVVLLIVRRYQDCRLFSKR